MKTKAMKTKKQVRKAARATAWNPLDELTGWGVRSSHAYTAGFIAIAISLVSWLARRRRDGNGGRRGTWGVFLGHWAPTLFGIGLALKHEE